MQPDDKRKGALEIDYETICDGWKKASKDQQRRWLDDLRDMLKVEGEQITIKLRRDIENLVRDIERHLRLELERIEGIEPLEL